MREQARIAVKAHGITAFFVVFWFVAIPLLAVRLDPYIDVDLPQQLTYLGYVIAPFALGLSYISLLVFIVRGRGTALPTDPPKVFVVRGPYRYVRNPMYIGNLIFILCEALIFRSPGIFLYFLIICVITNIYVAKTEEKALETRFGREYLAYKQNVRRWIPSLHWARNEKATA
jgi:protein-S-isoprenylcysteine O-methyltransferase Ste14